MYRHGKKVHTKSSELTHTYPTYIYVDRRMAQAISRWFLTAPFISVVIHVRFVIYRVTIELIFSQQFDLPLKVIILSLLQTQLSSEFGTEDPSEVAVPQTPSDLTDLLSGTGTRGHLRPRYLGIPRYSVFSPNCRHTHTHTHTNVNIFLFKDVFSTK
jgi:hypothetical protein